MENKHALTCVFILLITISFSLILGSCTQNSFVQEIEIMKSRPIKLSLDSMRFYVANNHSLSQEDSASLYMDNYSLVVYLDSSMCGPCALKHMYKWYETIDFVKSHYGNKLKIHFIFSPQKSQMAEFDYALENTLVDYPLFVDTIGIFQRENPHLPSNQLTHTFLLDKGHNVIMVGSPLASPSIKTLFYQTADKEILDSMNQ